MRVSWLSPLFNEVEVSKFVEKFLQTRHAKFEINRIQKECYKDSSIQNGVIKMWVKYDICDHRHVLDLVGIYELCGQMAHIHIAGIPPKCMHCKEFGHIRSKCSGFQKYCQKCKVHGHTEGNGCSTATHLAGLNNRDPVSHVDLDAPEGDDFTSTQHTTEFVEQDNVQMEQNGHDEEQNGQNGHDEEQNGHDEERNGHDEEQNGHDEEQNSNYGEQNEPVYHASKNAAQNYENLSDSSYAESGVQTNDMNENGEKNSNKRPAENSPSNISHEQNSSLLNDTICKNGLPYIIYGDFNAKTKVVGCKGVPRIEMEIF